MLHILHKKQSINYISSIAEIFLPNFGCYNII
jgi:hypothetical protein